VAIEESRANSKSLRIMAGELYKYEDRSSKDEVLISLSSCAMREILSPTFMEELLGMLLEIFGELIKEKLCR
jgi:hypothetical protein